MAEPKNIEELESEYDYCYAQTETDENTVFAKWIPKIESYEGIIKECDDNIADYTNQINEYIREINLLQKQNGSNEEIRKIQSDIKDIQDLIEAAKAKKKKALQALEQYNNHLRVALNHFHVYLNKAEALQSIAYAKMQRIAGYHILNGVKNHGAAMAASTSANAEDKKDRYASANSNIVALKTRIMEDQSTIMSLQKRIEKYAGKDKDTPDARVR